MSFSLTIYVSTTAQHQPFFKWYFLQFFSLLAFIIHVHIIMTEISYNGFSNNGRPVVIAIYYCHRHVCTCLLCQFKWLILADFGALNLDMYLLPENWEDHIQCVIANGETGSKWKTQRERESARLHCHSTLRGERQTTRAQSAARWHDGISQSKSDRGNHHDSAVRRERRSEADRAADRQTDWMGQGGKNDIY